MIEEFFTPILALELLIFLWIIGNNKWFTTKMSVLLSAILLICFSVSILFKDPYSILLIYFFWILQIYLSYKKTETLLLPTIYIVLQNTCISLPWILLHDLPYFFIISSKFRNYPIEKAYVYVIQMLFLCLLIYTLKRIDKKMSFWTSLSRVTNKHTSFSMTVIVLYFAVLFFRQRSFARNDSMGYFYLSIFLLIYTFSLIIVVYSINEKFQNDNYIELLSKEMIKSHQQIVTINEFRHDYKSLLLNLNRFLDLNDIGGAKKYLCEIANYSGEILTANPYDQIKNIPLIPLQGLLINFAEQCESTGIKLTLDIKSISPHINMGLIDFLRCISILLNNALESSSGEVFFSLHQNDNLITCRVRNTYEGELKLASMFRKGYSSKIGHSGLGLSTFTKLIKKYNNLHYSVEAEENWVSFIMYIRQ